MKKSLHERLWDCCEEDKRLINERIAEIDKEIALRQERTSVLGADIVVLKQGDLDKCKSRVDFACTECGCLFKVRRSIMRSYKVVNGGIVVFYKCPTCGDICVALDG